MPWPGSYVAEVFSVIAVACAFALTLVTPRPAPAAVAAPEPAPAWQPTGAPPEPQPRPATYPAALPPAGWYPDPAGTHHQRFWDGQRWTAQTS